MNNAIQAQEHSFGTYGRPQLDLRQLTAHCSCCATTTTTNIRNPFSCNKQVVRGQISLPSEHEFRSAHFNLSANANFTGSWAALGFAEADPAAAHCWQLKADSPLLMSMGSSIDMEAIGTPEWQQRWPCKTGEDGSDNGDR